ncbi:hypothetical protein RchiOBHm_Chr0c09g0498131 [Rosa chinensis]|uniref:Uncharacterized protein n=1 Tax=Rosa chinensis TaxID=74649 RepID=A0A2P6SQV1_ROSCH|nr:hypothetical protein RchiOBHm_Chr0c09g0498131 [Rosa chinensis]
MGCSRVWDTPTRANKAPFFRMVRSFPIFYYDLTSGASPVSFIQRGWNVLHEL